MLNMCGLAIHLGWARASQAAPRRNVNTGSPPDLTDALKARRTDRPMRKAFRSTGPDSPPWIHPRAMAHSASHSC